MQLSRDAAYREALDQFDLALKADGELSAAHLRSALMRFAKNLATAQAGQRDHFKAAFSGRASLSEHDALLLDAVEPIFRQPRQLAEAERKLGALLDRVPDDVDYLFWDALLLYATGSEERARASYVRLVALDPTFCLAWARYGDSLSNTSDDVEGAFHAYDACLRACPNATRCLRSRARLEAHEGRCGALRTDAERLVDLEPNEPEWQYWLAKGLDAQGATLDAVQTVMRKAEAQTPEPERPLQTLWDRVRGDELRGDFVAASSKLREIHALLEGVPHSSPHADQALEATTVAFESGTPEAAAAAAKDYLQHADAWDLEGWSLDEIRLAMASAAHAAGTISSSDFDARRAEWLERARRLDGWFLNRHNYWYGSYLHATDAESMRAAVESVPDFGVDCRSSPPGAPCFGPENRDNLVDLVTGRVYLLGGRVDDGIRFLEPAAHSCSALDEPIPRTQAHFWLGQALEQTRDTRGACAAYEVILRRWGHAKPRSVTADKARERVQALGCPNGVSPKPAPSR
jgi:serine/threonine-protein kinase